MAAALRAVLGSARKPLALLGLCVAVLATAAIAKAIGPVQIPFSDLEVTARWSVHPSRLPKDRDAPVAIHGGFEVGTRSGAHPPAVREIDFELDRRISLATKGLPVCRPSIELQTRESCRDSIVGEGHAQVEIQFAEQEPILASSRVTVFYGHPQRISERSRRSTAGASRTAAPAFFIQLVLPVPVPAAVVMPVTVRRVERGVYGYRAEARVPVIAGGAASLVRLRLRIGKRWTYEGKRYSLLRARCAAGRLGSRAEFSFADGALLRTTFSQPCQVKR